MGQTKDFFKSKKSWSFFKDEIINCYLKPYIAKILTTRKPLTIIDCFAGKGNFDDDSEGSPVIIAKHIKSILESDNKNKDIRAIFIEKKYHNELKNTLTNYRQCAVWAGTFEENLDKILKLNPNTNLFIYVDPYGIKSLDFSRFKEIKNKNFFTLEMLINFNSFGFLRESCRLLKNEDIFKNADDEDDYELDDYDNVSSMNSIANGDYWQTIIDAFKNKKVDLFEAEELFTSEYVKQFKNLFKYAANIPIRLKSNRMPKYRLIFGTNSQDGAILMTDNMNRRWKELLNAQRGGQKVLFEYEFPDLSIQQNFNLEKDILSILQKRSSSILMKELIVELIEKYGISFSEKEYKDKIREMEGKKLITIDRKPKYTPKGKEATSLDYRNRIILVSLK